MKEEIRSWTIFCGIYPILIVKICPQSFVSNFWGQFIQQETISFYSLIRKSN